MAGLVLWTLLEYGLHRYLLHGPFAAAHAFHHLRPHAFIALPGWMMAIALWAMVFVALVTAPTLATAGWVFAGEMAGFIWYTVLHRAIHDGRVTSERHKRHHAGCGNYGVTTPVWDWLLGTQC